MSSTKQDDVFVFRQRSGALEWKKLAALNVDDIIADSAVGSLQALVDNVTFSEVTQDDLDASPEGSTLTLVHTMQLITEYLLTGQEQQAEKIQKLYYRYTGLKRKCAKLETANVRLRDDVGVYRDELQVMRKVRVYSYVCVCVWLCVCVCLCALLSPSSSVSPSLTPTYFHYHAHTHRYTEGLIPMMAEVKVLTQTKKTQQTSTLTLRAHSLPRSSAMPMGRPLFPQMAATAVTATQTTMKAWVVARLPLPPKL